MYKSSKLRKGSFVAVIACALSVLGGEEAFAAGAADDFVCDSYYGSSDTGRLTHNVQVRTAEVHRNGTLQMYVLHIAQIWIDPAAVAPRWLYQQHIGNHPQRLTQVDTQRGMLDERAASSLCRILTEADFNAVGEAFEDENPLRDHGSMYDQIIFNRTSAVAMSRDEPIGRAAVEVWQLLHTSGLVSQSR